MDGNQDDVRLVCAGLTAQLVPLLVHLHMVEHPSWMQQPASPVDPLSEAWCRGVPHHLPLRLPCTCLKAAQARLTATGASAAADRPGVLQRR